MRGGGKPKKKPPMVVAVPEGLQIEDEKRFYKDIRSALTSSVGAGFLDQKKMLIGQRQVV